MAETIPDRMHAVLLTGHGGFDLRTLYPRDLTFYRCTFQDPDVFGNLVGYVERGEIKPMLSKVYPLSDIVAAQQDILDKKFTGKLALEIPG